MYCVYYIMDHFDEMVPKCDFFDHLNHALAWTNTMRERGYKFVTMVSENPDCVSLTGATGMDADDYEWKKRR